MTTLYDTDFHAWCLAQAEALRQTAEAPPPQGRVPGQVPGRTLDWSNLAGEIESMGHEQRFACEAYVEQIIAFLLKLQFTGPEAGQALAAHWRTEITAFRAGLEKKLSASIEDRLRTDMDRRYQVGRRLALSALGTIDPGLASHLPETCPYTMEQLGDYDWLPIPVRRRLTGEDSYGDLSV
ncbi:DUF29 domain-containing protein [uncultured Gammaproteobacteria bacterium]